jgi:hypothetical protein
VPPAEKSVMDVFVEGIRARNRGDTIEGNPYPADSKNHDPWREGWRIYDVCGKTRRPMRSYLNASRGATCIDR